MKTCAFIGHREGDYEEYREYIEDILIDLIEEEGVTQFYSGGRGKFDDICASIVASLKTEFPQIKNTLVLSYIPQDKNKFVLDKKYDDSVYLLEGETLPKFAISKTNEKMMDRADFVVAWVRYGWGGAQSAYRYAKRKKKKIVNIYDFTKEWDRELAQEQEFHDFIESLDREEKERVWRKITKRMEE